MLELDLSYKRIILHNFKNFKKLHTCALEHAFVQKPTKTQKHTQNQKKTKKIYFFS
jgi:hypothetical protein